MVRRHIAEALGRGEQPVLYGARITGGGSGGDGPGPPPPFSHPAPNLLISEPCHIQSLLIIIQMMFACLRAGRLTITVLVFRLTRCQVCTTTTDACGELQDGCWVQGRCASWGRLQRRGRAQWMPSLLSTKTPPNTNPGSSRAPPQALMPLAHYKSRSRVAQLQRPKLGPTWLELAVVVDQLEGGVRYHII